MLLGSDSSSEQALKLEKVLSSLPWVLGGDFNEILSAVEKWGGNSRCQRQMQDFRDVLDDCDLMDMSYCGPPFTWTKVKGKHVFIQERLDRGLCNGSQTCSPWL